MDEITMTIYEHPGQEPVKLVVAVGEEETHLSLEAAESELGPLPPRPYQVTYRLSEDGEFQSMGVAILRRETGGRCLSVCFLSLEWSGKRLAREVS